MLLRPHGILRNQRDLPPDASDASKQKLPDSLSAPTVSLRWMSEYKREFQWRPPNKSSVTVSSSPRTASSLVTQRGSSEAAWDSTDSGSEQVQGDDAASVATSSTTAAFRNAGLQEGLPAHSIDNLVRVNPDQARRPPAAGPVRRSSWQVDPNHIVVDELEKRYGGHQKLSRPSIEEEYANVKSKLLPASLPRTLHTDYISQRSDGLLRPFSPAPSSQASSYDIQEEMDRRYGRENGRSRYDRETQNDIGRFYQQREEEEPDSESSSVQRPLYSKGNNTASKRMATSSRDERLQPAALNQQSKKVNQRAINASVGKGEDIDRLSSRREQYQTEYQRQFLDWTEKLYGSPGKKQVAPSVRVTDVKENENPKTREALIETGRKGHVRVVAPPERDQIGGNRTSDKKPGERILQYAIEPPPTWNLAQDILQRARQRRHEFAL